MVKRERERERANNATYLNNTDETAFVSYSAEHSANSTKHSNACTTLLV